MSLGLVKYILVKKNCVLEREIFFTYDGIWQRGPSIIIDNQCCVGRHVEFNIRQCIIGDYCLMASGCKFIDLDHGYSRRNMLMCIQAEGAELPIVLEEDVWIGVNVIVLKGATVGRGAIVAAGSVVTKSIPSCEIWAGIPPHNISQRLS